MAQVWLVTSEATEEDDKAVRWKGPGLLNGCPLIRNVGFGIYGSKNEASVYSFENSSVEAAGNF